MEKHLQWAVDGKQELVARRPGLVTSPLKLKEEQSSDIFADQSAIFWMRVCEYI